MSALPALALRSFTTRSVLDTTGVVVWVEDLVRDGVVDPLIADLFMCWPPLHRVALTANTLDGYWEVADASANHHVLFREFQFIPGAGGLSALTPVHPGVGVGGDACGYVAATRSRPQLPFIAICTTEEQCSAARASGILTMAFDTHSIVSADITLPSGEPARWQGIINDALMARHRVPPP